MFYNEEQILQLKNQTKKYLIISSVVLGISLALFVTLLFFLNDQIIRYVQVDVSIVLSLAVCFFLYVIINIVLNNNRRQKFIDNILKKEEATYECTILEIGKIRTINHNIKVYDVTISYKGRIVTVLLDDEYSGKIHELKGLVTLKVCDKYIVEIIK